MKFEPYDWEIRVESSSEYEAAYYKKTRVASTDSFNQWHISHVFRDLSQAEIIKILSFVKELSKLTRDCLREDVLGSIREHKDLEIKVAT